MNKKITWGLIIIFISLFYLFQKYIPEGILMYVFNYQVIIILIGISEKKFFRTGYIIYRIISVSSEIFQ